MKQSAKGREKDACLGLIKYVAEKKVRHKWLKEVEVVSEVPKSASGKILRRVLKERAKAGQGGQIIVKAPEQQRAKL